MITDIIFNEDGGTQKPSMIIDEQCEVKLLMDHDLPGVMYLIFETLDERAVIALEVESSKREEACEILINAFDKIGELADEAE